jgi:16S rRNA processing protein RimM
MYIIGKILKPQGRHGEVKAEIITSFPEHFCKLGAVFIKKTKDWLSYSVDDVRLTDKFVFIKLAGIDSIDQAEQLRGEYLYVPEDDLENLSDSEYYIHDLIGMQVYDQKDILLGEIMDVEMFPANDVYTVKLLDGSLHTIPAVSDVVKGVNIEQNKMIIRVLDGLFE